MLNFIICEDNKEVCKLNEYIVNNIMFDNNIDYKIFSFNKYDEELQKIIDESIGKKIYILDIEIGEESGIEIARKIRNKDWESIIIMSTAHSELFPQVFKDKLMLFDYISKFDNYSENLENTIKKVIGIYELNKFLKFNIRKTKYKVLYDEVLYFLYDKGERKTFIKTLNSEYKVSKSMSELTKDIPSNFIKINQHCIINIKKIKLIKGKNKLVFINNTILNEPIKNEREVDNYVLG